MLASPPAKALVLLATCYSQVPSAAHADPTAMTNNQMVMESDANRFRSGREMTSAADVGRAWQGISRRMIMGDDQRRRIQFERSSEDRIYSERRFEHGATGYDLVPQQVVGSVEVEAMDLFDRRA